MKKSRIISIACSLLTALTMLAVNACAYIEVVSGPSSYLDNDESQWMIKLGEGDKEYIRDITRIEMTVSVKGNADLYYSELKNGVPNGDFTGFLGLGAFVEGTNVSNQFWQQYDFKSLLETAGDSKHVGIKSLGDNKYMFTASLDGIKVSPTASDATISLKDWGNFSPDYRLAVEEVNVYGADGSIAIHSDSKGNLTFGAGPAAAETTAAETTAETTVETTAETTTEATTTTEAVTEETATETTPEESAAETASEETTTAETTTAATTTTAAPATTEAATTSEELAATEAAETEAPAETTAAAVTTASNANFGSRDSSLLIVGIVAGVVIIALIVAIVVVMGKKKR